MESYSYCLSTELTEREIDEAAKALHYQPEDLPLLRSVYQSMRPVRARAYIRLYSGRVECALTLGNKIDVLQERLAGDGRVTESYMVECLAMECMKKAYPAVAERVYEKSRLWPGRMQFPGDGEPLERIAKILKNWEQEEITCNRAYMLRPLKSVVYTADLTAERPAEGLCGVCASCRNTECGMRHVRRQDGGMQQRGGPVKTQETRLNYGYRRILAGTGQDIDNKEETMEKGLIHLYCGDGKGKTTAALGLSLRAAGAGREVVFVPFMKGRETSELNSLALIPKITIIRSEKEFGFYHSLDEVQKEELTQIHNGILRRALDRIEAGECDLLVLDEVTYAWNWQLLERRLIERLILQKPEPLELVLTGREPTGLFREHADYITQMQNIRHPYADKIEARKGIEF